MLRKKRVFLYFLAKKLVFYTNSESGSEKQVRLCCNSGLRAAIAAKRMSAVLRTPLAELGKYNLAHQIRLFHGQLSMMIKRENFSLEVQRME